MLLAFLKHEYTLEKMADRGWNTLTACVAPAARDLPSAPGAPRWLTCCPIPTSASTRRRWCLFSHILWGSVWAGVAAAATTRAQAFVRQAMRASGGQAPPAAGQLTKAVATLRTLRGLLASALHSYERAMDDEKVVGSLEFQSMITLLKVEVSELACKTVLDAMRACGLSGYRNDGDFSIGRHLRDVLSSPVMINNDRILASLAALSAVTQLPASIDS